MRLVWYEILSYFRPISSRCKRIPAHTSKRRRGMGRLDIYVDWKGPARCKANSISLRCLTRLTCMITHLSSRSSSLMYLQNPLDFQK
jgi:hypothetical protein